MNSEHAAKLLSLYKKGVVTVPELANALLIDLIEDDGPETELPPFVTTLPEEVGQRLRELLREIQKADYRWRPFMLGPGGSVLQSETDDSARLQRLCVVLGID